MRGIFRNYKTIPGIFVLVYICSVGNAWMQPEEKKKMLSKAYPNPDYTDRQERLQKEKDKLAIKPK